MSDIRVGSRIARKVPALLSVICVACTWLIAAQAAEPGITVDHYDLDIQLDMAAASIAGTVSIDFTGSAGSSTALQLDMAQELTAHSVVLDGQDVDFTRAAGVLTVPMEHGTDGSHNLVIHYDGKPGPQLLHFDQVQGAAYAASYGIPHSGRHWWPSFDSPAVKAKSADIHVTVAKGLTVASNGRLVQVESLPDGRDRYDWKEAYPIYADVISVAVAPYTEFDASYASVTGKALPLHYFVFKEDVDKAKTEFAGVPEMLKAYEALFGPYPFQGEQYGIAEMMLGSFREHQTLPSLGKAFIEAPKAATEADDVSTVIAHDLAHQWFGNSLTPASWSDIWLNESFSNYAVALWRERAEGTASYHQFMQELDTHDFSGSLYVADTHDFKAMFGTTTFNKGPWVLHMLRHVMGDPKFFAALHAYADGHRYGQVSTATWMAACERQYGKSLDWFFEEWVYGAGQPVFKTDWSETGGKLDLKITQTQSGQAFTMPVDIEIDGDSGITRETLWLRDKEESTSFPVRGRVKAVILDPDAWVLKD